MQSGRRKQMEEAMSFIRTYHRQRGISPSIREVQEHLHVGSSSTAYLIIRQLEKEGQIIRTSKTPRSIAVIRQDLKHPGGKSK